MTNLTPEQIAEWKRLADAATDDRFSPAGTTFDETTNQWKSGVHIEGRGQAIVITGYSIEFCKSLSAFIATARTAVPALIAEVERLKAERDAAQKALRVVQNAAKTLAHSRDSELQHLRENRAYDHKLRAEHDSLIERDSMMTDRIAALEAERDALKEALAGLRPWTEWQADR